MTDETTRPDFVTDEMLEYLDDLRESGVTNMGGAAPYVAAAFDLGRSESLAELTYWMRTLGERQPREDE